jgi:hypothetical protein
MSILLTAVHSLDARLPDGPVHRTIVAFDIEESTKRNNQAKGELRRILYELAERALHVAGIGPEHLERLTDRGDGVLILIRPHDDVPKTLVLGRLIPALTGLLFEHNARVTRPELRLRLRAVVHAGEVHDDDRGFYGDDLDVACRLLDAPNLKKALKEASGSPLILVVSDEIYHGIVQQGYLDGSPYRPLGRVRVGNRQRRGWMHVPAPMDFEPPAAMRQPAGQPPAGQLTIATRTGSPRVSRDTVARGRPPGWRGSLNARAGRRPARG